MTPSPQMQRAMRTSMRASQERRKLSAQEIEDLRLQMAAARPDPKQFFATMAISSVTSGALVSTSGWQTMNEAVLPLLAVIPTLLGQW